MARVVAGPALAALSAEGPGLARAFESVAADLAALSHAVDAIAARARAGTGGATMAQLRAGRRGRRSEAVAAAYRRHRRMRRLRADGWGLDPSLAPIASFATGGSCILRNPFPYHTATTVEHFVL